MTQPTLIINFGAMLAAFAAAFILGGLWYGPLFSKPWAKEMGMSIDKPPPRAVMLRSMAIQAFGLLLTSYVLMHTVQVWRASVWGAGTDGPDYVYALSGAFFTWFGFYVPIQLGKISWEGKSWKLFAINAGHDLANLLVMSFILSYWR